MLLEFLSWWLRQLGECIPRRLRAATQANDSLLLRPLGGDLDVSLRRRGKETPLGSFTMDRDGLAAAASSCRGKKLPAVLVLPRGSLLERPAELPLAAERDLHGVVGYEMDRLTPFARDDVAWSARVEARNRERGRIAVRLTLVPKSILCPAMDAIQSLGVTLAAVESDAADGVIRRIALVPPELAGRRKRFLLAAFGLAGALACTAAVLPLIRQTIAFAEVSGKIAELAPQMARVDALRQKLSSGATSADLFRSERERTGDVLQILAALTNVLPDDTVLTSVSLRARHLSFTGESSSAARLIPMLAADSHFRNPSFAAPVTRAGDRQVDLFSINSDLRP